MARGFLNVDNCGGLQQLTTCHRAVLYTVRVPHNTSSLIRSVQHAR